LDFEVGRTGITIYFTPKKYYRISQMRLFSPFYIFSKSYDGKIYLIEQQTYNCQFRLVFEDLCYFKGIFMKSGLNIGSYTHIIDYFQLCFNCADAFQIMSLSIRRDL